MASRAASGTSSTVTVGRSTLRPRISGEASPIWASTPLITGRRLMTMWSLLSSTSGVSPSSTRTTSLWAVSTAAFQSRAKVSDATKVETWSPTKFSTAPDSGTARIWARSGRASWRICSGSISWFSCSVRYALRAVWTPGSSIRLPARLLKLSVFRKLLRTNTPRQAATSRMHDMTTPITARTPRTRPLRLLRVWSTSTSWANSSRSAFSAATSSSSAAAVPSAGVGSSSAAISRAAAR